MMKEEKDNALIAVLSIIPTSIMIGLFASVAQGLTKAFEIDVGVAINLEDFEEWMTNLWKSYGRKQPKHYVVM